MLPNFFILGARKCGTTSLHYYLGQHPQILMSEPKEPRWFSESYDEGLAAYGRFFSHWSGQDAVGDASAVNIFLPWVPARIHESLPEARLIVALRNPVSRAFSDWWMAHNLISTDPLSFEDALEANLKLIASGFSLEDAAGQRAWHAHYADHVNRRGSTKLRFYLQMGYYAEQLVRYRALFPPERMRVILVDDLDRDPHGVARDLFGFLGVDATVPLRDTTKQNVSLGSGGGRLYQAARKRGMGPRLPAPVGRAARRLLSVLGDKRKEMPVAARRQLADHYRPHNERLSAMLGVDLSHWR